MKQVRSILEIASPVWAGAITLEQSKIIERVQKCAFSIILAKNYMTYTNACQVLKMETLFIRRKSQCLKFAQKALKHQRHKNWFKFNTKLINTRSTKTSFVPVDKFAQF